MGRALLLLALGVASAEEYRRPPPLGIDQAPVPTQANVTYAQALVCPPDTQNVCGWGAANQTGFVVKDLVLDVYNPTGHHDRYKSDRSSVPKDNLSPAMVIIHGGAYWTGDKRDQPIIERATFFASKGFVVFSINYRLTGDTGQVPPGWPATNKDNMTWIPEYAYPSVRDSKAAIRWVKANAANYKVDPAKVVVFGESAGSCNTMAIALTFEDDYKTELNATQDPTLISTNLNQSSKVACVLDHWGSDDISTQLTKRDQRVRYTADNAPVAIFHGTADGLVPYANALQIDAGYNKTGVKHALFPLTGQGHGCWDAKTTDGKTQDEAGYEFVTQVLGAM
jgi:acetyl esterase/lipase